MHGRRKDEYQRTLLARSQAEKEAAKNKVFKYKQLMELALQQRQEKRHCKEALVTGEALENDLVLSSQLLRINPDVYTLWNYRKEMIVASKIIRQEAEDGETEKEECENEREGGKAPLPPGSFLQKELDLVIDCIRKNPKSYGAWHHRRWLLDHAFSPSPSAAPPNPSSPVPPLPALSRQLKPVLDRELSLCAKLLDLDERNFHCWSYRRWVVSKHPARTPRDEFEFSTSRILKNFRYMPCTPLYAKRFTSSQISLYRFG
jgi:geranylgeranyl transferase type-2 subunit alpha